MSSTRVLGTIVSFPPLQYELICVVLNIQWPQYYGQNGF